jgi:hypothetical protein
MTQALGQSQHRKARVYDRLEDGEGLEGPRTRFSEVDAAAEAWRPGAVVALASECDELLAAQRTGGGAASGVAAANGGWSLTTLATEWSSRGKHRNWQRQAGKEDRRLARCCRCPCNSHHCHLPPNLSPLTDDAFASPRPTPLAGLQAPRAGTPMPATMRWKAWSRSASSACCVTALA